MVLILYCDGNFVLMSTKGSVQPDAPPCTKILANKAICIPGQRPPGVDRRGEQRVQNRGGHREAVLVLLEHGLAGALPNGPVDVEDGVAAERIRDARHGLLRPDREAKNLA